MESRRFYRAGILALDPRAFGLEFLIAAAPAERAAFETCGSIAVVDVCGPLTHGDPFFDSYSAIRGRVALALASEARAVVLRIDSPGGDVFGAFDTARALRADAKAAGKRLFAFSEARCQSAGYALASSAEAISVSSVASVGSIGVIVAHADLTGADQAMGVRFEVFASGERKADGNPHIPLTDEARASIQRSIDETAAVFFALVKDHRGIDAKSFAGRTWVGASAVADEIVNRIESWDEMLARLEVELSEPSAGAKQEVAPKAPKASREYGMTDEEKEKDESRKALSAAAASGNARAKRALAAYDAEDDKEAAADDDEKEAASDEAEKKDDEKAASEDEKKEASGAPGGAIAAAAGDLVGQLTAANARIAKLEARDAAEDFAALKASRKDIPDAVWKTLAPLPLAQARAIVNATPKAGNPFAPPQGNPTLGTAPTDKDSPAPRAEARVEDIQDPRVARAMGLAPAESEFKNSGAVHYPSLAAKQVTP